MAVTGTRTTAQNGPINSARFVPNWQQNALILTLSERQDCIDRYCCRMMKAENGHIHAVCF